LKTYLRTLARAAVASGGLVAAAAHAQPVTGTSIAIEGATDWRERGLSWSDGKPAVGVSATIPVASSLEFDLAGVTLRDSERHGGADLALSVTPRYVVTTGGWRLGAGVRANVFAGRSGMNYVELNGEIERTIGPARLMAAVDYAPSQNSIGGHNFHVEGRASVGIPGLPLTVYGGVGHTSGSSRNDPRAWRLRPGGSYSDHHVGIEHSALNLALGARYSDTSIDIDEVPAAATYYDRHLGARMVGYIRFSI